MSLKSGNKWSPLKMFCGHKQRQHYTDHAAQSPGHKLVSFTMLGLFCGHTGFPLLLEDTRRIFWRSMLVPSCFWAVGGVSLLPGHIIRLLVNQRSFSHAQVILKAPSNNIHKTIRNHKYIFAIKGDFYISLLNLLNH